MADLGGADTVGDAPADAADDKEGSVTLVFRGAAGDEVGAIELVCASGSRAPNGLAPVLQLSAGEAAAHGEAELQLLEGLRYEYECLSPHHRLQLRGTDQKDVVLPSRLKSQRHTGMLVPGLATGMLPLALADERGHELGWAALEVRSRKLRYREDYREMLEEITARCVALLSDWRAASQFKAEPDPGHGAETLGQRFAFVRALLAAPVFKNALQRVCSRPHTRWEGEAYEQSVARGLRADRRALQQLARGGRRVPVPNGHALRGVLGSVPTTLQLTRAVITEDTAENRFVKFALESFQHFLQRVAERVVPAREPRLTLELRSLQQGLEMALQSDVLRHVGRPDTLPLWSPVLQRREGYREVLQAWLQFDMAARLVWQGGQSVYGAGQRDVATLYEYWVFFKLLDLMAELFELTQPASASLIEETADGLGLKLKSGKHLALKGVCTKYHRKLRVEFSYNRTFSPAQSPKASGSWTEAMRPDYTLSLWPDEFTPTQAEAQELMVHVHFDAKYRVDQLQDLLRGAALSTDSGDGAGDAQQQDELLDEEKREQARGRVKRADLLKMHAYRDAIRRSHGAYVLYPGEQHRELKGFHEILPGLGAFALRPGQGTSDIKAFLEKVVAHVCDRASTREQQSYATFRNYHAEERSALYGPLPERDPALNERHAPPQDTYVIAGWVKDKEHMGWVRKNGLYNFRMAAERGSLALSPKVAGARYILLHGNAGTIEPQLWRIKDARGGPRVFTSAELVAQGYPSTPSAANYLVYELELAPELGGLNWDFTKLAKPANTKQGFPYAFNLQELLETSTNGRDGSPRE